MWTSRLLFSCWVVIAVVAEVGNAQWSTAQPQQGQQQSQQPQQGQGGQPQGPGQQPVAVQTPPTVQPTTEMPPAAPTPSPIDCRIREDGNYLPDEAPCSQLYYVCSHGVSRHQFCPRDTFFNTDSGHCDFRENVADCPPIVKMTPKPTRQPQTPSSPQPQTPPSEQPAPVAPEQTSSPSTTQSTTSTPSTTQSTPKYTKKTHSTTEPESKTSLTSPAHDSQQPSDQKPKHYHKNSTKSPDTKPSDN